MKILAILTTGALLVIGATDVTHAQDELPTEEMPTEEMPTPTPSEAPEAAPVPAAEPQRRPSAQRNRPAQRPGPVARPQVRQTRYSRYRASWYIGFGLGGGAGWLSTDGGSTDSEGGVVGLFKIGWVVQPWLLLGGEISIWVAPLDDGDTTLTFAHYDAVATIFPIFDQGLYFKGGLGFGSTILDSDDYDVSESEIGFDLKLGTGWEFQVGRSLTIGADLTYTLTANADFRTHDVGLAGTLNWY
jgi:hypothetical protein